MHDVPFRSVPQSQSSDLWYSHSRNRIHLLVHTENDPSRELPRVNIPPVVFEKATPEKELLTINRPRRGTVPFQNLVTPSSVKIRYAQCSELRYCDLAWSDCIRVFTTLGVSARDWTLNDDDCGAYSSGMVESDRHQPPPLGTGFVVPILQDVDLQTVMTPAAAPIPNVMELGN